MADAKISALTENTTLNANDLLPLVDDPAGNPATQKTTLQTIADWLASLSQTLTNKTITSPVIDGTAQATADGINVSSMSRQAVMNGNFDVWQRGTSTTTTTSGLYDLADRWLRGYTADSGTPPTLTQTRQALTPGDIPNAFYHYRLAPNGAGTSLGNNSYFFISQRIEYGTRYLCGDGKKVTLSFWARSDIANKRIGYSLFQGYGTGGTPTTGEKITGDVATLTSSWTKYTYTFTTNTLVGKTFGTANDDSLQILFSAQWGATFGNDWVKPSVTAESYGGSGYIDIAQVQLCAGDVALPFQPKSYAQELADCQRYCYRAGAINGETPGSYQDYGIGMCLNTTIARLSVRFPVRMRLNPPTMSTSGTDSHFQLYDGAGAYACSDVPILQSATGSNASIQLYFTVASGLTAYRPIIFMNNNTGNGWIQFDAEL